MTPTEALLWERLRARRFRGLKCYRQRLWGRFVLDFYCPELLLAIEVDGAVHEEPNQVARDRERDALIEARGLRIVRLSAAAIERDPLGALENALAPYLSSPPLRKGGEGAGG